MLATIIKHQFLFSVSFERAMCFLCRARSFDFVAHTGHKRTHFSVALSAWTTRNPMVILNERLNESHFKQA